MEQSAKEITGYSRFVVSWGKSVAGGRKSWWEDLEVTADGARSSNRKGKCG